MVYRYAKIFDWGLLQIYLVNCYFFYLNSLLLTSVSICSLNNFLYFFTVDIIFPIIIHVEREICNEKPLSTVYKSNNSSNNGCKYLAIYD